MGRLLVRGALFVLGVSVSAAVFGCSRPGGKGSDPSPSPSGSADKVALSQSAAPVQKQEVALEVVGPAFDFGKIVEGDTVKHSFEIRNRSKKTVKLDKVWSNATTMVPTLGATSLDPGASVKLDIVFDTLGYVGDIERHVLVGPADESVPSAKAVVKGHVEVLIALERLVKVNPIIGEKRGLREYAFVGAKAAEADLSIADKGHPDLIVEIVTRPQEGGPPVRVLSVQMPFDKIGYYGSGVVINTGLEKRPQLEQNISWEVVGRVSVLPGAFVFKSDLPDGQPAQVVELKSDVPGFVVKSAVSASPVFKASVHKMDKDNTWEIRVEAVDNAALAKMPLSVVKVTTNDKYQSAFEIPISVFPTYKPYPVPSHRRRPNAPKPAETSK